MKITPFHRLEGWGLATYTQLIQRTARYQVEGWEHVEQALAAGRPLIIAAWHGMTMMLAGYLTAYDDPGRYVMIAPDDSRGAPLSIWAQRMGTIPFVISMKADSMVAARRLLALIRQIKQGRRLVINPDGPYGPSHEPKGGVAFIARKSGALIIPTGAFTAAAYRVPRWDRYVVPFPFSRIALVFGEPLEIAPKADPEQSRGEIRERLNEVERAVEELYRAGKRPAD